MEKQQIQIEHTLYYLLYIHKWRIVINFGHRIGKPVSISSIVFILSDIISYNMKLSTTATNWSWKNAINMYIEYFFL